LNTSIFQPQLATGQYAIRRRFSLFDDTSEVRRAPPISRFRLPDSNTSPTFSSRIFALAFAAIWRFAAGIDTDINALPF
jgi:hypothetical protein